VTRPKESVTRSAFCSERKAHCTGSCTPPKIASSDRRTYMVRFDSPAPTGGRNHSPLSHRVISRSLRAWTSTTQTTWPFAKDNLAAAAVAPSLDTSD